jgi:hypothetical protein
MHELHLALQTDDSSPVGILSSWETRVMAAVAAVAVATAAAGLAGTRSGY